MSLNLEDKKEEQEIKELLIRQNAILEAICMILADQQNYTFPDIINDILNGG